MDKELETWKCLLEKYGKIRSSKEGVLGEGPTLLELCSYPSHRFEEICSRILCFFFNWNAEHGFRDLWLKSVFECFLNENESVDTYGNVNIWTEEKTVEGKRIDIVAEAEDWVLAIENKISADLYNPLDLYKNHIENKYQQKKRRYLMVLSLRNSEFDHRIRENGFGYVSYKELLRRVKTNMGTYLVGVNQYYLNLMIDFIKTLENKMATDLTDDQKRFFSDNKDQLESLVKDFQRFQQELLSERERSINKIKATLDQTPNTVIGEWWIYNGMDLGHHYIGKNVLGIESWYCGSGLKDYEIVITTWNRIYWDQYKEVVVSTFKEKFGEDVWKEDLTSNPKRSYYRHMLNEPDEDQIKEKLLVVHNVMKEIESRVDKSIKI